MTSAVGDKASLATATSGQVAKLVFEGSYQEATQLASQMVTLVDAVDDPAVAAMQLPIGSMAKLMSGEITEGLRLAQRVIDLCDRDRYLGNVVVESPLTLALMLRAAARMLTGAPGWKQDMLSAAADTREFAPIGAGVALTWRYAVGVVAGAFRADSAAVWETASLAFAEQMADDLNAVAARRICMPWFWRNTTGPEKSTGWHC